MLDAGADVWPVHTVVSEQQRGGSRQRRRTKHLQLGNVPRTHVPALQHEPWVVETVVIVEVAEERVGDVGSLEAALHQAMVSARAVIHHQEITTGLEEIAGALAAKRWRRRSSPKQRDSHAALMSRSAASIRRFAMPALLRHSPHAQHMPSHIFTRVGYWNESISSNRAAAALAKAGNEPDDRLHASDYLVYAYLQQQARDEDARAVIDEMTTVTGYNPDRNTGPFALAASQARCGARRLGGGSVAHDCTIEIRLCRCDDLLRAGPRRHPFRAARRRRGGCRQAGRTSGHVACRQRSALGAAGPTSSGRSSRRAAVRRRASAKRLSTRCGPPPTPRTGLKEPR
jgi:hypothetical protein